MIPGINDAKKFLKNNGGKRILKFKDVKESLIVLLNGKI